MNITLKQIESFLAVARTLSFSQAAEQIHLSQPALSANIRRLEDIVGARLFDRDTRTVSLSMVGTAFMPIATGLMDNVEQGLTHIQDILAGQEGRLNIAVAPSVAAGVLPDILVRFMADHPRIRLRVHDVLSQGCVDMVRSGAADLALMPMRGDVDDLAQQLLFRDPLVVLCAPHHPLAGRRNLQWKDIIPCQLIVRSTDSSVRQLLDAQYLAHGAVLRPAFEVAHVGTVLGLIVAGLGIGILPSSVMRTVNMEGLAIGHFGKRATPYWSIGACTPKNRSSPPTVAFFIQQCLERFRTGAQDRAKAV
ncbi:LysR family transcriptional regulator [Hydrogenophaga sp. BPS33]|uniref:LysR family transcriptional regulator n=1 Tax=Hydrogenophaga sp. BPS33 TaxID=2651974 RepID=UPI00135C604B|nr:LysR family transcriptional regulator [Hydrogenophaga sp. BPS33]